MYIVAGTKNKVEKGTEVTLTDGVNKGRKATFITGKPKERAHGTLFDVKVEGIGLRSYNVLVLGVEKA